MTPDTFSLCLICLTTTVPRRSVGTTLVLREQERITGKTLKVACGAVDTHNGVLSTACTTAGSTTGIASVPITFYAIRTGEPGISPALVPKVAVLTSAPASAVSVSV